MAVLPIPSITGYTQLLAVIAKPIRHSLSPRMHTIAAAKLGLDYTYLAFEVGPDLLADAVHGFKALGVRGWNLSMPHKVEIIPLLDELSPAVKMVGACNTVVNDAGVLTGHITDGVGYIAGLRENGVDLAGKRLTLVGVGGAGTAIAVQAALDGVAQIDIYSRRGTSWPAGEKTALTISENTATTVKMHELDDLDSFRESVAASAVLANATSVGMGKQEGHSALPTIDVLRPDLFVSDAIYHPTKTKFLEHAETAGCRFMNGLPMLLHQGAAAFKLFTGHDMPVDYVREHLFE